MKKKAGRLKHGALTDMIFEAIANGLIEGWRGYPRGFRLPMVLGYVIKYILEIKKMKVKREKIEKAIKNLKQRKILSIKRKNDKVYVYLKEKGEKRVIKHSIKLLLDFKKKKKRWNGKWFLVFFDVPEIERRKRNYLRQLLKELGFYQYQESVYIFPYECEREVVLIRKIVDAGKFMKYIIAEKIEEEEKIKKFFNLV